MTRNVWPSLTIGQLFAFALIWLTAVAAAPASAASAPAAKQPAAASAAASSERDVAVTVYNQNLGVVKDRRKFTIAAGLSDLKFTDVASSIDPTSVHLRPLGKNALEILWQDYRFDLVSTDKLLERYVDQPIEIATKD